MSENTEEHIECPKCSWEPDGGAHWMCHCLHMWNTFATYGKCPSCGFVHKNTQCISCGKKSPHPDWYTDLHNLKLDIETAEIREL